MRDIYQCFREGSVATGVTGSNGMPSAQSNMLFPKIEKQTFHGRRILFEVHFSSEHQSLSYLKETIIPQVDLA